MLDGRVVLAVLLAKGIITRGELERICWTLLSIEPGFEAEETENAVMRLAGRLQSAVEV